MSKLTIVPDGQGPLTPYLVTKDAAAAIAFYKTAFGATELFRLTEPSGKVGHAELRARPREPGQDAEGDGGGLQQTSGRHGTV